MHQFRNNLVSVFAGGALCALASTAPIAAENPFASTLAPGSDQVVAQGKCGEGKCGGGMKQGGKGACKMNRMDTDGDGKVSREEFIKGHEAKFDSIDADNDGYIDDAERQTHRQKMMHMKGKSGQGGG